MKKMKILLMIILLITFWGCESDSESKKDEFKDKLQNLLLSDLHDQLPGIQVSIISPKFEQINESVGIFEQDSAKLLTNSHILRIASATKLFTATLIMKLVEDSLLNLSTTLADLLPEIETENSNLITVRNLLNHTSDFIGYFNDDISFQDYVLDHPNQVYSPLELVKRSLKLHTPQNNEIGHKFYYCNTNYVILGMILEKVSGKFFQNLIMENISNIAGLDYTEALNDSEENPNLSEGHLFLDEIIKTKKYNHSFLFSAGNIVSNSSDLVCFLQALLDGKILKMSSLTQMKKYFISEDGDKYGLGIGVFKDLGFGHNGLTLGYASILIHNDEHNITIAVLINSYNQITSPEDIAKQILNLTIEASD